MESKTIMHKGFEIFVDDTNFDLVSVRFKTIKDYNNTKSFISVEAAKSYLDGYLDGYEARNPLIIVNNWKDETNVNYSAKTVRDKD